MTVIFGRRKNPRYIAEENKCPICECELHFARFQHIEICADQVGTERAQQVAAFEWLKTIEDRHPVVAGFHATPNAGKRSINEGLRFKREGLRAGYPDTGLDHAARGHNGLRLEFKTQAKSSKPTDKQIWWLDFLWRQNYFCQIVRHWTEFRDVVLWYLEEIETVPEGWPSQREAIMSRPKRKRKNIARN